MPPDPKVLIAQLRDVESREKAARALEAGGNTSIYQLLETLGDDDPEVRCRVVWVLEAIGSPAAVPGLVNSLDDPDPAVRAAIVYALKRIGGSLAMDGVRSALNDPDSNVRREAARALGEMGDVIGVAPLLAALGDADENVARAAAASLGQIGGAGASRGLVGALSDHRRDVKVAAIRALGELEDPTAMRWLEPLTRHTDEKTQLAAREVVAKLDSVMPSLPEHIRKQRQARHFQARVRKMIWIAVIAVPVMIVGAGVFSAVMSATTNIGPLPDQTLRPTESREHNATQRPIDPTKSAAQSEVEQVVGSMEPLPGGSLGLFMIQAGDSPILDVAFSRNGLNILSLAELDQQVMIWDADSGEAFGSYIYNHTGSPNPIAAEFSQDGEYIAQIDYDGNISIWDIKGADQLANSAAWDFEFSTKSDLSWSFEDNTMLVVSGAQEVGILSLDSDEVQILPHDGSIYATAIAPDHETVAIVLSSDFLVIQSLNSGLPEMVVEQPANNAYELAWQGEGEMLAMGGINNGVTIWNIIEQQVIAVLDDHGLSTTALEWSPDGTMLAAASGHGTVSVWNTSDFELEMSLSIGIEASSLAWSPDSAAIVVGDELGAVTVAKLK